MGMNWAEHTIEIDAPIETCFDAIVDYESFPAWQGAVVSTEVLDRHKDGLGKRVRLSVDAKVRKVDYTLDYRYERPTRIEWDYVEGNGIDDADGHYLFESLGDDRTRATYKLGLEVGIPLPGPVARRAHKQTLAGSVEDLKREAERRATAEEGAKSASRAKGGLAGFGRRRPPSEREGEAPPESRPAEAPAPDAAEDEMRRRLGGRISARVRERIPDSAGAAASGPTDLAGRAISLGRGAAGTTIRTGRDVATGAVRAGVGVARSTVGAGIGLARTATDRAARLVRRARG
jgi:uncharacterized membrane protein